MKYKCQTTSVNLGITLFQKEAEVSYSWSIVTSSQKRHIHTTPSRYYRLLNLTYFNIQPTSSTLHLLE